MNAARRAATAIANLARAGLAGAGLAGAGLARAGLAGAGLVLLASAPVARAQAPTPAAPTIAASAIQPLLEQLDACYGRGDVEAYLAPFAPDHPGSHAQLRRQLAAAFAMGVPLQRVTRLVGEPRPIGARTVVRVHHEVRAADGSSRATFVQDSMLALRRAADGAVVPTFAVDIASEVAGAPGERFRCPACNYEIGGVPGWLCVPQRGDRAMALEAATFFLLGSDISCDISVQIDGGRATAAAAPAAPTATTLADTLAAALRQLEPNARLGLATAWSPAFTGRTAADAVKLPPHLTAARLAVDLPAETGAADGCRAVFHTVALGALQHVLLVRGGTASLAQHDAAVQALLASYRVLDADRDRALAAAEPLAHHTGGSLRGSTYHNAKWQVELTGPAPWTVEQRPGGALFRVVWSSPAGGRLWLIGYPVPAGMDRWCQETADLWLQELLAERGLRVVEAPTATAAAWQEDLTCSAASRLVTCSDAAPGSPLPQRRVLRLVVRDELLVVVDASAGTTAEWPLLQTALDSLRRP